MLSQPAWRRLPAVLGGICDAHQIWRSFAPLSLWVKAPKLFPNQRHTSYSSISPHGDILLSTEMGHVNAYLSAPSMKDQKQSPFLLPLFCAATLDHLHFLGFGSFKLCHKVWVWPFETLVVTKVTRAANGPGVPVATDYLLSFTT